jgi:hypothetical protein
MDKLTINELKGYLGTGLTVSIQSELYPNPQVIGIVRDVVYLNYHGSSLSMNIDKIKPYLHPLSSLTEYREDLGFVPIEELQRLFEFDDDFEITNHLQILLHNLADGHYYFPPNFFLNLYEKLYSWHIDVHNLIDRNLAINIKALKQ